MGDPVGAERPSQCEWPELRERELTCKQGVLIVWRADDLGDLPFILIY